MKEQQLVQHVSGQGKAFEVFDERLDFWICKGVSGYSPWLPKSEYILCDPPERWEKCEVQIVPTFHPKIGGVIGDRVMCGGDILADLKCGGKYRIHTLIVERKVQ